MFCSVSKYYIYIYIYIYVCVYIYIYICVYIYIPREFVNSTLYIVILNKYIYIYIFPLKLTVH